MAKAKSRRRDRQGQARGKSGWDPWAWIPFAVLGLLFFWRILFGWGGTRRYLWDDFLEFVYPARHFAAVWLARGEIPFWNPHVFAGMPFLADIQSAVFYPLNLVLMVFAEDGRVALTAVEAIAAVHIVLAGLFTFLLARRLGAGNWGAWVSGITFMFSGFLVTHVIHLNVIEVAVWFPLSFLLLHLAFTMRSVLYAFLAGISMAVSFLGGSPQVALLSYIGLGLFTLYATGREVGRQRTFSLAWLRVPSLAALAVAFSVGLCAFQILPSYRLSQLSVRPQLSYEQSLECSMPPQNLVTFFIPHFFGATAGGDFLSYWGVGRYYAFWEMCGYVGVVGLLLAWVGLRKSERPYRAFFAALAVISLLLAAGKYGGIHRLFFAAVPGYDRFRVPSRALMLFVFSASILAGYGADVLTSRVRGGLGPWCRRLAWQWGLLSAGVLIASVVLFRSLGLGHTLMSGVVIDWTYFASRAAPFVGFALAGAAVLEMRGREWTSGTATGVVLVGLVVADLFAFGQSHNEGRCPPEEYYPSGEIVDVLKPAEGEALYRVQTRAPSGAVLIRRNQGQINGVFNVDGYNQLKLDLYETFDVDRDLKLDLLNTRYRVRPGPVPGTMEVVQSRSHLPRVLLVPEVVRAQDGAQALQIMNRGDFDPFRTVVVQESMPWEPGQAGPFLEEPRIVAYSPNRIEVEATLDHPGVLLFSEIYYPCWRAEVDGERRPVLRADYALRAVPLEAGSHRVVMAYASDPFWQGLIVSGVCLLVGLGLVACRLVGLRI